MKSLFTAYLILVFNLGLIAQTEELKLPKYLSLAGSWCKGDLCLASTYTKKTGTWQWTLDGRKLPETGPEINLTDYGTGIYKVILRNQAGRVIYSDSFEYLQPDGPVAAFAQSPYETEGGIQFTNLSIMANGEPAPVNGYVYLWNFGDGDRAWAFSPFHAYQPGTYQVSLTVIDSVGCSHMTGMPVTYAP